MEVKEEEKERETGQMEVEEEAERVTGQVGVDPIMAVGLTMEVDLTTVVRYIPIFS